MYLDWIRLQNFRTFRKVRIDLVHPDRDFELLGIPRPRLPNLNLLLGNNGLGKSAFLKGVALAALGPAAPSAGIFPYRLVRREPGRPLSDAILTASFHPHPQDHTPPGIEEIESEVGVHARGDLETIVWRRPDDDEQLWHPVWQASSDAFFAVGYGASRRVEPRERVDLATRKSTSFARAQRLLSLFQESYTLIPLTAWLPDLANANPGRFAQVRTLMNRLTGRGHYQFTGEIEGGEYLFARGGMKVPFPALSDGYRAWLGWIGDLLYHIVSTCPAGKKLVDNRGIVMVDEIDLHLHPRWQIALLPALAKALPKIQFIVTSHSPLLVGSLEWMNIIEMRPGVRESSIPKRIPIDIHGLDADQVLLTDFFGMKSTRAGAKDTQLRNLALKARHGDAAAARQFLEQMSRGLESGK